MVCRNENFDHDWHFVALAPDEDIDVFSAERSVEIDLRLIFNLSGRCGRRQRLDFVV